MSEKLKIYACSGIGETDSQEQPIRFWTDGTNTISNTQAVNTLLVKINSAYIRASKQDWNVHKLELLNDVDMLSVALEAAKHYATDNEGLHRAGEVISHMIQEGAFESQETDATARENHLEELIDKFYAIHNDDEPLSNVSPDFMDWWKINVEQRNKVGLNFGQQQAVRKALKKAVSGVGEIDPAWKENPEIANYLLNAGTYFIYLYFTDAQLAKAPATLKVKRKNQQRVYNHCKGYFVGVYGSEEEMQQIIRDSIYAEFSREPEQVIDDMLNGKSSTNGVGPIEVAITITAEIFVKILLAVFTTLIAIVSLICKAVVQSNADKYASIDQSIIDGGCPSPEDEEALNRLKKKTQASDSWIGWAAAGLGLLFILKN